VSDRRKALLDRETETLLDEINAEIDERVRKGERPTIEEYERRYPHLKAHIEPLLEVAFRLQDAFESIALRKASTKGARASRETDATS